MRLSEERKMCGPKWSLKRTHTHSLPRFIFVSTSNPSVIFVEKSNFDKVKKSVRKKEKYQKNMHIWDNIRRQQRIREKSEHCLKETQTKWKHSPKTWKVCVLAALAEWRVAAIKCEKSSQVGQGQCLSSMSEFKRKTLHTLLNRAALSFEDEILVFFVEARLPPDVKTGDYFW